MGGRFIVTALAAGLSAAACGGSSEKRGPALVIDERRGTYRGVGIGDRAAVVRRVFGPREFAGTNERISPTESDFVDDGGPTVVSVPCKPTTPVRGGPSRHRWLRYAEVTFLFCDGRVFAFMVTDEAARTTAGIAIGDSLDEARDHYRRLRCGDAPAGDYRRYPYCAGSVHAGRHVWLGEDPSRSITVSTTAFDGYER